MPLPRLDTHALWSPSPTNPPGAAQGFMGDVGAEDELSRGGVPAAVRLYVESSE